MTFKILKAHQVLTNVHYEEGPAGCDDDDDSDNDDNFGGGVDHDLFGERTEEGTFNKR